MNKEILKSLLIRDKQFLRELYSGPNPLKNRRVLNGANDNQLNTLIKVLHCVVNGEIKVLKEHFENLQTSKKLKILRKYFEKKNDYKAVLNSERQEKIKILFQLSSVYPDLLYCLFNVV